MITFYDLLGIPRSAPDRRSLAANLWPSEEVRPFTGLSPGSDFLGLMDYLQGCLEFKAVHTGAGGGRVGLSAELHITSDVVLSPLPLVLVKMPDIEFFLQETRGVPAQVHVTRDGDDVELIVQGLPVEIRLPVGFIRPQRKPAPGQSADDLPNEMPDFETTSGPFNPQDPDSLQIILRDIRSSSIFVRIDVRMTPEFDFVIDTHMPITIGPCAFFDLACEAVHDLQLIPSPRLHAEGAIPVDWARHDLDVLSTARMVPGIVTFRAIDLDRTAEPVAKLLERASSTRPATNPGDLEEQNEVEPILEDLAFPLFMAPLPIPLHFRIGIRKVLFDLRSAAGEEYDLESAPVDIPIAGMHLKIFRALVQTTSDPEAAVAFKAVLVTGDSPTNSWSFLFDYTDEGVLTLGAIIPVEDRVRLFTVLNREIRLIGVKLGMALFDPNNVEARPAAVIPLGDVGWANRLIFLLDFEVRTVPPKPSPFSIDNKSGNPDQPAIFSALGWFLGGISLGNFYDPDSVEVKAFDRFRIEIEEVQFVSASNGASYLMLSAGIDLKIGKPDKKGNERGGGIHFHRLKFRLGDENDQAANVLLDGISLSLVTSSLKLEGFGMISEHFIGATRLQELAFGLQAELKISERTLKLGVGFFYGKATGAENFTYWMFNLVVGGIPLGSAELENVRLLVAGNMRPRLPPPDGNPQPFRLFRWYKQNGDAISLPINRQLTSWERFDDSFALGVGARLKMAGVDVVTLDGFFFYHDSPGEEGFLAALEIYFGKGDKPIGWGVIEVDSERGSMHLMIGVALSLENVLGKPDLPDALKRLAALTGTFMAGNNIDYYALGQFPDPATWLSLRLTWPHGWQSEIWAAICYHHVDSDDGPHVFALSVGAKGTLKIGVGSLQIYATLTLVAGRWRNEAVSCGVLITIEAGVRIRVFRVFNFGASIEIKLDWLGGPPKFSRQSFTFRIETPWWLPDVTVRFETTQGLPKLERQQVASSPMVGAAALPPATRAPLALGVTPLVGSTLVESAVFHLEQLRATGPAVVADAKFAALTPVSVDSTIALDFKAALDAPVTVVPDTPADAGKQESGELSLRYELVQIGIRRRKRFGPGAGVWVDLLTPESTHIGSIEDVSTVFTSAVRFEWDVDAIRQGRTDTRRLLVNADTAYSFSTNNPEGDDVAAETFPGWPCCTRRRRPRRFHEVDWDEGFTFGVRAPATQRFTESRSTFTWQGGPPPVVAPPNAAPAGSVPVFVHITPRPPGAIAVASFDERVALCEIYAYWKSQASASALVVEAFDGLKMLSSQSFSFNAEAPPVILVNTPKGMTSLLIRKVGGSPGVGLAAFGEGPVELIRVRYRTVREELDGAILDARCQLAEGRVHGSGMLAWLPNRDYEVTVRVRITLDHERNGAQDALVEQKAFFRTKGLPGLNAVARVGDEIEPYVASRYPGPGETRLYRRESLAVAFTERFNILVPVNRTPSTAEEANQILEWVLAVEKVGGATGFERLTQTAEDWVVLHRGTVLPRPPRHPLILTAAIFSTGERSAPSIDPLVLRYEAMKSRPGGCTDPGDALHPSQVLIHAPVDLGAPEGATPRWEAAQELRVNLRQKNAPFVERATFEEVDASAFTRAAAGGAAADWRSDGGVMRVEATTPPAAAQYAVFGDSDWRHVQIETAVDPAGGEAGIAVAFSGGQCVEALLSAAGQLRIIERVGATIRTLAGPVAVPPGDAPALFEVIAFDDRVRATVGSSTVEGALGAVREGRLALVSRGGGRFTRLHVGGLDAWRFHCRTSRYDDFPAHIGSWDGVLGLLRPGDVGTPSATVAELRTNTAAEVPQVMHAAADAERRQRLFETWTTSLGLPLREKPRDLSLTRWVETDATPLILLESDEPLPFSRDVTAALSRRIRIRTFPPFGDVVVADLELDGDRIVAPLLPPRVRGARRILRAVAGERGRLEAEVFEIERSPGEALLAQRTRMRVEWPRELGRAEAGTLVFVDDQNRAVFSPISPFDIFIWVPVAMTLLTNREETAALLIPDAPLATGSYRLEFTIDRRRWPAAAPDTTSNYRASATLAFALP